MDGARFFNAVVALGVPASELAAGVDSVTFCVSKGLSAPVGALLVGARDFIAEARRGRKLLGGGMRQAGIIAAAGLLGLTEMVERLADDHANARRLAEGLANIPGIQLAQDAVETNIFFFDALGPDGQPNSAAFVAASAEEGALFSGGDSGAIRAATHYGVEAADIERALAIVARVMAARQSWA
jgi:threonine aldolase